MHRYNDHFMRALTLLTALTFEPVITQTRQHVILADTRAVIETEQLTVSRITHLWGRKTSIDTFMCPVYLYHLFFCDHRIIFWDRTKDNKRGKFQVTGCMNVITLSKDVPFFLFFWQPVYNVFPFLYKWCYWHAVFFAD